jgi:hypothetical protein
MTKPTPLLRLEKKISASDRGGILERWRYGRTLLADPKLTTTAGHLRHGVTELLINAATAAGLKLSEREIRRRLQCARTYSTDAEIGRAAADFEGWTALADAGFPPLADQAEGVKPTLADQHTPATTPWQLATLADYLGDRERWTAAHSRKNAQLRAHLDELINACDGDLTVTYQVAINRARRATRT